jgi:hypothetical protein
LFLEAFIDKACYYQKHRYDKDVKIRFNASSWLCKNVYIDAFNITEEFFDYLVNNNILQEDIMAIGSKFSLVTAYRPSGRLYDILDNELFLEKSRKILHFAN